MAQASENSGPLLMNKTWETIQQKTFTKWVNSHLRKKNLVIQDLNTAFNDGIMLIQFLEIISNKDLGKYDKKPKMRIQKVGNISTALNFLKSQKIQLVNISPEDIADENIKLILGLIWIIIQKFAIEDISEEQLSAKEALLLWCQKKTAGYKDVKVDNFHYSFQDGLALCALIHRHRPDLLDFNKLNKDNKAENLQLAFDVAERELGIPKLLDVEDMVDIKPDERSVITYVAQYYHVFSKYNQAEVAGRRVGKLVDLTSALETMKNDYSDKARRLVDWINQVTPQLQDRNFDNSLEGVRGQIEEFKTFKTDDKPPKTADKATVEALFNNIALTLRANQRSAYEPPSGLSPSEIEGLWEKLENEERARESALRDELRRQEKIDHLRRRFNLKAGKLDAWLTAKEDYLNAEESVNSLNEAQTKLKTHEAFDDEYAKSQPRVDAVQQLANELKELNAPDAHDILSQSDKLVNRHSGLAGPQKTKRADLEDKLAKEQKKEELRLEWAKQTKEYNAWNKDTSNTVNDHNFGDTLEAVEAAGPKLSESDSQINNDNNTKKSALDDLWGQLQALGVTENRYTPLTIADIDASHKHLGEEVNQRRVAYDAELERQKHLEEKRKEFAAKAQEFADNVNARSGTVEQAALNGEPDEALTAVREAYQEGKPEHEGLSGLTTLQEELSALGIRDNKYTKYNLPDLITLNKRFVNNHRNISSSLNDEKELKNEYAAKAGELAEWINNTLPKLKERNFENTLAGIKGQHSEWQKYLTTDKGRHEIDFINLELLAKKIENVLSASKRPAFNPAQGTDQASLAAAWANLNQEEKEHETALNAELQRQEQLAVLVKRFQSDAEDLEAWFNEKEGYLSSQENVDSLDSARLRTKILEVFNAEFTNKSGGITGLTSLADQIRSHNYHDQATVDSRLASLNSKLNTFQEQAKAKKDYLEAALHQQNENEALRVAFAEKSRDYSKFIRDSSDAVSDHNFGYSLDDVAAHQAELDRHDSELTSKSDEHFNDLAQTSAKLAAAGVADNRHTKLTQADAEAARSQLTEGLSKRRQAYADELARQTTNDEGRKLYAQKANGFIEWVQSQKSALDSFQGTPEERINQTNDLYNGGTTANSLVEEIAQLDADNKSKGIFDNKYTPYPLPVIKTRKVQFDTSVNNFVSGLKEEKELAERSAAQQAEYEHKQKLENLRVNYTKDASDLYLWLESATETLTDPIKAESNEDAAKYKQVFNEIAGEKDAQSDRYGKLVDLHTEATTAGITDFGALSIDNLTKKWNDFLADYDTRSTNVDAEIARQEHNENLRVQFADAAKSLRQFITDNHSHLNAAGSGDLEADLADLQARRPSILGASELLAKVEDFHSQLEAAGVSNNPHTDLTFAVLRLEYDQLVKATGAKESLLQKEILKKKNSSVSAEQLAEFREVFEHFDKDKTGALRRLEFKSCLQSLGENPSDAEVDSLISQIGTDGTVNFEAFTELMVKRSSDSDSREQILEAFKTLAGDKAFITVDDLKRALPAEKVDYLSKHMTLYNGQEGHYDYTAWANASFGK
eukprot:TRINITY_DN12390_c0_g1_i1.p1 TRINITY_DN12390_c0_g1~~TRINITY_DN12390_c0_g1_i1.p1  ORF type:complete len:1553 (+),score=563.11 TRINITY_DN12390_c0_g1_i1:26-4660(+)